jgi:serine/threonine-protein kinase
MAPELLSGQRANPRVDVFAMGVLMHEAFSSRRLFRAETEAALISTVLRGEIPPLARYRSDVPKSVEQVIQGALARDPTQRYPDARALRDHFMQSLPPGMIETGLTQSEKFIAEFYEIVGLPGETLDPINDAPIKGRSITPRNMPARRDSLSDAFPADLDVGKGRGPRWLLPAVLGVVALGILVAGGVALINKPEPGSRDAGVVAVDAARAVDAAAAFPPAVDASTPPPVKDASDGANVDPRPKPKPRKLTVADIERTFNKHMGALNACGAQHRAVLPAGGVKIALVIGSDGTVKNAVLAPTSIQGTGLDSCLSKIVARMRFPAHKDAEMSVTVPLQFQIQ